MLMKINSILSNPYVIQIDFALLFCQNIADLPSKILLKYNFVENIVFLQNNPTKNQSKSHIFSHKLTLLYYSVNILLMDPLKHKIPQLNFIQNKVFAQQKSKLLFPNPSPQLS